MNIAVIWTTAKKIGSLLSPRGWLISLMAITLSLGIGIGVKAVRDEVSEHREAVVAKIEAEAKNSELKAIIDKMVEEKENKERIDRITQNLAQKTLEDTQKRLLEASAREVIIYKDYGNDTPEGICVDTVVPQPIVDGLLQYAKDRNSVY